MNSSVARILRSEIGNLKIFQNQVSRSKNKFAVQGDPELNRFPIIHANCQITIRIFFKVSSNKVFCKEPQQMRNNPRDQCGPDSLWKAVIINQTSLQTRRFLCDLLTPKDERSQMVIGSCLLHPLSLPLCILDNVGSPKWSKSSTVCGM